MWGGVGYIVLVLEGSTIDDPKTPWCQSANAVSQPPWARSGVQPLGRPHPRPLSGPSGGVGLGGGASGGGCFKCPHRLLDGLASGCPRDGRLSPATTTLRRTARHPAGGAGWMEGAGSLSHISGVMSHHRAVFGPLG